MAWFDPEAKVTASRHLQLFIPSEAFDGSPMPHGQDHWVRRALTVLGESFGGATAFPPGLGVWRDDDGDLHFDETVIVISYAADDDLTGDAGDALHTFMCEMGREGEQGEVGIFVDGTYYGITDYDKEAS